MVNLGGSPETAAPEQRGFEVTTAKVFMEEPAGFQLYKVEDIDGALSDNFNALCSLAAAQRTPILEQRRQPVPSPWQRAHFS